jgi:hypothetical protein
MKKMHLYYNMTPESRNSAAEETFIARQQVGKQVLAVTNKQTRFKMLLSYNDGDCLLLDPSTGYITRNPGQLNNN